MRVPDFFLIIFTHQNTFMPSFGTSAAWSLLNKFSPQILFFIRYKAMLHWLSLIICFQLTKHRASLWGQLVQLICRGQDSLEGLLIYLPGALTRLLPARLASWTRLILSPHCFSLVECDWYNLWYKLVSNKTINMLSRPWGKKSEVAIDKRPEMWRLSLRAVLKCQSLVEDLDFAANVGMLTGHSFEDDILLEITRSVPERSW